MFFIGLIFQLLFNVLRLFFIGYIIRLIFRNTTYGRIALVLITGYQIFIYVSNIGTLTLLFDLIASFMSLILYVVVYDFKNIKRPRKLKGLDSRFRTLYSEKVFFFLLSSVTWLIAIMTHLLLVLDVWLLIILAIINIVSFLMLQRYKSERVFLLLGKHERTLYEYAIPKKVYSYSPKEFFPSDAYILDYVAILYEPNVKTHIYALPVDGINDNLLQHAKKVDIPYDVIHHLKKYQFVSITVKNKTLRVKRLK